MDLEPGVFRTHDSCRNMPPKWPRAMTIAAVAMAIAAIAVAANRR